MKNKKKVYTVTFHLANNYGAMLQAYALQKFLLNNGYDAKIINYDNFKISDHYRIFKKDKKNLIKFVLHIVPRLNIIIREIQKEKNFSKYRKKLAMTKYVTNYNEVVNLLENKDTVICGSDQIWNPYITGGLDKVYFLQFNQRKIRKIAYAASCGSIDKINDLNTFEAYLKNIDCVSVREEEINNKISEFNINSKVVLDPSLLLTKEDWIESISSDRLVSEKYIFTYSVGNGNDLYYKTINELSKKYGYKVVYFDKACSKIKGKKINYYSAGPEEFLNLLYYSEFVITTSFHGFALSCVLNKKIFPILSSYPDRLVTLAKSIGMENRFIVDESNIEYFDSNDIDWENVNKNIVKRRDESSKWLIGSIDKKR